MRFELNDRNGNFILAVDQPDHLRRILKFMDKSNENVRDELIVWETDSAGDIVPLDPWTI